MTGVCADADTAPASSTRVGVGALERGRGISAGEGARSSIGGGLGGSGGGAGLCSSAMCALGGMARGGGWGLGRDFVSAGSCWAIAGRVDSEIDGLPSVICMMNPLLLPDGASISNSGRPEGGLVVYRTLPLRPDPFFFKDDMVGSICKAPCEINNYDRRQTENPKEREGCGAADCLERGREQ